MPRSLKLKQLLRGLTVTVNVATAGSTVTAAADRQRPAHRAQRLDRQDDRDRQGKRRKAKAGALRLRLKPTRKAARALRRTKRALKLRLKVRVAPPAGKAQTATTRSPSGADDGREHDVTGGFAPHWSPLPHAWFF